MVNDNGLEYYTELPANYILMDNLWELFKLKDPTKEKIMSNIELRKGLILILYNPQTKEYYPRYLSESTDRKNLEKYFNDMNLYICKDDLIWNKSV